MKASISVTTYNRVKLSEITLLSIWATVPRDEVEILVADNCSTDGTDKMLKHYQDQGLIDKIHTNNWNKQLGVLSNNVIDLTHKDAEWLVLLANDEYCMSGWWENFCKCTADPKMEAIYTSLRAHSVYEDPPRSIVKIRFGGNILAYDPSVAIGVGLAMRHSMIKRTGFRFVERWQDTLGSIYSIVQDDFNLDGVLCFEMAKPCVLSQNCEFDNKAYESYYNTFFGIRKTTERLARLRNNKEGYFTQDSKRALAKFYEGSDYMYYSGADANKRNLVEKIGNIKPWKM